MMTDDGMLKKLGESRAARSYLRPEHSRPRALRLAPTFPSGYVRSVILARAEAEAVNADHEGTKDGRGRRKKGNHGGHGGARRGKEREASGLLSTSTSQVFWGRNDGTACCADHRSSSSLLMSSGSAFTASRLGSHHSTIIGRKNPAFSRAMR